MHGSSPSLYNETPETMAASAWDIAWPIPRPGPIEPIAIAKPAPKIDAIATRLTLSINTPPLIQIYQAEEPSFFTA
jgi:hypothetical protein